MLPKQSGEKYTKHLSSDVNRMPSFKIVNLCLLYITISPSSSLILLKSPDEEKNLNFIQPSSLLTVKVLTKSLTLLTLILYFCYENLEPFGYRIQSVISIINYS